MRKDTKSIPRKCKFAAALFGGCLSIFVSALTSATNAPDENINLDVTAARELLDSWSGQPQILEQAREILIRNLKVAPQDYLALKEVARYQIMAGYIKQRYARNKTHIYTVGTYSPGTLERAEATIREAIRINPRFAEGYVLLGHIQFEQTKLEESAKSLATAEALGTNDPWLHLNWATLHNAREEFSAAKKRMQRVLQSGTSNIKALTAAYSRLIENHIEAGEHDEAVALYKEQINLNPNNAWLRGNFAAYLSGMLDRHDEAISQVRAALQIMDYGMGRRTLAMALYQKWANMVAQGNEADAEKYFKEAWENFPYLNEVMVYEAAEARDERLAKALITKKGVSIDSRVEDGSTALLIATNRNRVKTVQILLDLNANPNIGDKNGWTPLLSAADEGNSEIVSMLLAKGADIRVTLRGDSAAVLAERRGKADLAALLRKKAATIK